jgi:hypothetical protein
VPEAVIDRAALERLAKALAFICGDEHPTTIALRLAVESGSDSDVKRARGAFLKLASRDRHAVMVMLKG